MAAMICNRLRSYLNLQSPITRPLNPAGRMMRGAREYVSGGRTRILTKKVIEECKDIKKWAKMAVDHHNGQQQNKNKLEFVEVVKGYVTTCAGFNYGFTLKLKDEQGNHNLYDTEVWQKPSLRDFEFTEILPASNGSEFLSGCDPGFAKDRYLNIPGDYPLHGTT